MLIDTRCDGTRRLAQSTMALRWTRPHAIGMNVIRVQLLLSQLSQLGQRLLALDDVNRHLGLEER